MSDEEISVRSDSSEDEFESDVEDIEEELPLSEEKAEDEEEEEEDEEDNGEPDPWVDDMFDDAMSQDSENGGMAPSSVGQSSFVHNGFLGPAPGSVGNNSFSVIAGSNPSTTANANAAAAAAKKRPAKQSNNYMTAYEFTKIIGVRSEQIMHGSQVLIQTNSIDPIQIAKEELKAGMIPLRIRRTLPDKGGVKIEDWYVHEFENVEALLEFYDY
jgi:DNA-directed RNA polymerase subunit K/omega